ncbi:MAG: hypothetical protein ACFFDT_22175 [Candidatus Hodarchaeota archaeon]
MISKLQKKGILVSLVVVILFFTNFWNVAGLTITNPNLENNNISKTNTNNRIQSRQVIDPPFIGDPHLNASSFQSNEAASIGAPITDADGIKNATLFWRYETINDTLYNTTMTGVYNAFIDGEITTIPNWLDETGQISETETDWRSGNYTYESPENEVISEISVNINAEGPHFQLVYVLIEAKNTTSNDWEIVFEDGEINNTIDLGIVNYMDTNTTKGYRIFAVAFSDSKSTIPPTITLTLYRNEYSGVIPGPGQSTWVNYYILAYDNTENHTTSSTYTFLMDWSPVIIITDIPTVLTTDQGFMVNVTITDEDGVGTIDDSSVVTYYRLQEETEWSSIGLSHITDISSTEAAYRGTIPASTFNGLETTLFLMVNASDRLGGQSGYEATTGIISVTIDDLAPRLTEIFIEGGAAALGLENITTITSEVNITAIFTDASEINSVYIYYAIPTGSDLVKLEMTNITATTFMATLPPAENDSIVEYLFEPTDIYGNKANTSSNYYYADGIGPILDTTITYPPIISNVTNGIILFNASDNSGLQQAVVWYSLDNNSWSNALGDQIDYNALILYQKMLSAVDLPFYIPAATTAYVSLEVSPLSKIDTAILNIEFTHEQGTDVRIWLALDDERTFLIFDREAGQGLFTLNVDLFKLGLNQTDFHKGNVSLKIQDYSELYFGSIDKFEIELIQYSIPPNYQYLASIPPTGNDTVVHYYITLTDGLNNAQNSSLYSYYSDGLPPNITLTAISSPLDMQGNSYLNIEAQVTDTGSLSGVEIYYKYSNTSQWIIESMTYDSESGQYIFDIPMQSEEGIVYYKIRAYDQVGYNSESEIYIVEYTNAEIAVSDEDGLGGLLLILGLGIVLLAVGGAVGVYLVKNKGLVEKIMRKRPED